MSESLDNSFKSSPESSPTHDLTEQNPSHSGNGSSDHPEPPSIDSAIEADDLFHSLNSEYKVDSSQSTHAGSQEVSNPNDFEDELRILGDAINGTSDKDEVDTGSAGETGNKRKRNESLGESSSAKRFRSSSSVDSNLDVNKDDDAELAAGGSSPQKSKKQQQEDERLKMQLLVSNFSEDQLNRYEMFRRAAFPKAAIKRLMQSISCTTVSQSVVIAMSGIAKVFVGEIVESALDVMDKQNQSGPLQPKHIREAVRRMRSKNNIPTNKYKKKLFR